MAKIQKLEDICELIVDSEHKTAPTQDKGYPSIRTPNIGKGRLVLNGVRRVSEKTYKKWTRRAIPQADDLILAREAPVGNVAIIPDNLKVCLGQRTVLIRPNKSKVYPQYLVYFLLGNEIQAKFQSFANGSTVHHLNLRDIRKLELHNIPSFLTQQKIASILSAYDDLIENNNRRIEILEEMARSLYREWFVKFRFPGHEQVNFVDSELGLIPEDWRNLSVQNIGASGKSIVSGPFGSNISKKFFVKEGVPVIRGNNLKNPSKKFIDEGFVFITEEKAHQLRNCEALSGDIIVTAAGTLGQVGLVPPKNKYPKYIISNKQLRLRCNQNLVLPEYAYYCLSTPEMRSYIIGQNKGSSVPLITLGILKNIPILIPPISLQEKFTNFVKKQDMITVNLEKQNINLRQQRDLLLPKLISGKIDVENLDIQTS